MIQKSEIVKLWNEYLMECKNDEKMRQVEPFSDLVQKYREIYEQYKKEFDALYEKNIHNVSRYEYSRGGEVMHRGFYSPSSTDLVAGGCGRGRILKNKPKNNNYHYEYWFDKDNQLICVKKDAGYEELFSPNEIEFLMYESECCVSLIYSIKSKELNYISICYYAKGKLRQYELAQVSDYERQFICHEVHMESFEYEENKLLTMELCVYSPFRRGIKNCRVKFWNKNKYPYMCWDRYVFEHDENGKLSAYTVTTMKMDGTICGNPSEKYRI